MTTQLVGDMIRRGRTSRVLTYGCGVLAGVYAAYRGTTWLRKKYAQRVWGRGAAPNTADRVRMASPGDLDPEC